MFPLMAWELIPDAIADSKLVEWGHWLGGCNRPFGRHSFGLSLEAEIVAVAVSASTVAPRCGGMARKEVVELARLCSHPDHTDLTRVALRLWRKTAPTAWGREYWPVRAVVSYSNSIRHTGDIYRFDGWKNIFDVPGEVNTDSRTGKKRKTDPKKVWVFHLPTPLQKGGSE